MPYRRSWRVLPNRDDADPGRAAAKRSGDSVPLFVERLEDRRVLNGASAVLVGDLLLISGGTAPDAVDDVISISLHTEGDDRHWIAVDLGTEVDLFNARDVAAIDVRLLNGDDLLTLAIPSHTKQPLTITVDGGGGDDIVLLADRGPGTGHAGRITIDAESIRFRDPEFHLAAGDLDLVGTVELLGDRKLVLGGDLEIEGDVRGTDQAFSVTAVGSIDISGELGTASNALQRIELDAAAISLSDVFADERVSLDAPLLKLSGEISAKSVDLTGDVEIDGNVAVSATDDLLDLRLNPIIGGAADSLTLRGDDGVRLGSIGGLDTLDVDSAWGEILLSADVTTTGDQFFRADVTVSPDVTVQAMNVTFAKRLDAVEENVSLNVNAAGMATFCGEIGGLSPFAMFTVDGPSPAATTVLGANLHAIGAVEFLDPVLLKGDVAVTSAVGSIRFGGTIDGDEGGPHALSLATFGLTGDIRLEGNVGDAGPPSQLTLHSAGGTIRVFGDLTATDLIQVTGDLVLVRDVTLTSQSGDIEFDGRVDSEAGQTRELFAAASNGTVRFAGAVGGTAAGEPGALVVIAQVTEFLGTVDLRGPLTVTAGAIEFHDDVTATGTAAAATLSVTQRLTIHNGADFRLERSFTQLGPGETFLGGNITTQGADVSFATAVMLTASVEIEASGGESPGGEIRFADALEGMTPGGESLTLTTAGGRVRFDETVGRDQRLSDVVILDAQDVSIVGAFAAESLVQLSGTGTTLIDGAVTLHGPRGLDLATGIIVQNALLDTGTSARGGSIRLSAATDVQLQALTSSGRDVEIAAERHVEISASGEVRAPSGSIRINADPDGTLAGNGGKITMTDGALLVASGPIDMIAGGEIAVGRIESGDRVGLVSLHRGITDAGDLGGVDIRAQGLGVLTAAGFGSENAMETAVETFAARNTLNGHGTIQLQNVSGRTLIVGEVTGPFAEFETLSGIVNDGGAPGRIVVTNLGAIVVDRAIDNRSGGGIEIRAEDNRTDADDLTLNAAITAIGRTGDAPSPVAPSGRMSASIAGGGLAALTEASIRLTAADDVILSDTPAVADVHGHDVEITAGDELIWPDGVFVRSFNGSAAAPTPFLIEFETPQITATGIGSAQGTFGRSGEAGYVFTINWDDGCIDTYHQFGETLLLLRTDPECEECGTGIPTATTSGESQELLVIDGETAFTLFHRYFSPTDPDHPAAPIPIDITVTTAASLSFTAGGNDLGVFTDNDEAPNPGEGNNAVFIFDLSIEVPQIEAPKVVLGDAPQTAAPVVVDAAQTVEAAAAVEADQGADERILIIERIAPNGAVDVDSQGRPWRLSVAGDDAQRMLDDLDGLFRKLDGGHWRIYLKQGAEGQSQLVRDVLLRNGKPAGDDAGTQDRPPTDEGTSPRPMSHFRLSPDSESFVPDDVKTMGPSEQGIAVADGGHASNPVAEPSSPTVPPESSDRDAAGKPLGMVAPLWLVSWTWLRSRAARSVRLPERWPALRSRPRRENESPDSSIPDGVERDPRSTGMN